MAYLKTQQPMSAGRARERIYIVAIVILLVWNVYLQVNGTSLMGEVGWDAQARAATSYQRSGINDESTPDFVNPVEAGVIPFGSAGVVCSGCDTTSIINGSMNAYRNFMNYSKRV